MSLIAIEGFETSIANWNVLPSGYWDSQYQVFGDTSASAIRTGASGAYFDGYGHLRMNLSNEDEVIFGLMFDASGAANNSLAYLIDDGTVQVTLVRESANVKVYRGTSSGTLLGTSSETLTYNQDYIECRIKIHSTAGTVDVKVNGTLGLSLTGQNTQASANAYATVAGFGYPGGGHNVSWVDKWDDLYIITCDGTSPNSWIGRAKVGLAKPTGAGNYTQWTPSAGSNYQCVDETGANDDTDYVYDDTASQKDTYAMTDISESAVQIFGVRASMRIRKDDAGSKSARLIARVNSTDYGGDGVGMDDAYGCYDHVWLLSPDTSSAWTKSEFDSAEFGVEVIS